MIQTVRVRCVGIETTPTRGTGVGLNKGHLNAFYNKVSSLKWKRFFFEMADIKMRMNDAYNFIYSHILKVPAFSACL